MKQPRMGHLTHVFIWQAEQFWKKLKIKKFKKAFWAFHTNWDWIWSVPDPTTVLNKIQKGGSKQRPAAEKNHSSCNKCYSLRHSVLVDPTTGVLVTFAQEFGSCVPWKLRICPSCPLSPLKGIKGRATLSTIQISFVIQRSQEKSLSCGDWE